MSSKTKLYSFRLYEFRALEETLPTEFSTGKPAVVMAKVEIRFLPHDDSDFGHSIKTWLRFPYQADISFAQVKNMVRAELPKFLLEAGRLVEAHNSEDASEVWSEDGLS